MHVTARSYLTAGIAALGAGVIALGPIQPVTGHAAAAPQRVVENLAVELAASVDPITALVNTFTTTVGNVSNLITLAFQQPFPLLSAVTANAVTYFNELISGNGALIPGQILGNIQTFFAAPFDVGSTTTYPVGPAPQTPVTFPFPNDYVSLTTPAIGNGPDGLYDFAVQLAVGDSITDKCAIDGDCLLETLGPVLNIFNTHAVGFLLGALGPILSPVIALTNSIGAAFESLVAGDFISAVFELINIPTNLVNGVLNGAGYLDLTQIVNALVPLGINAQIGVNLGGLLNAVPQNGSLRPGSVTPPSEYGGGVGWDGVALYYQERDARFPGLPIGLAGSVLGMGQFLGDAIRVTPPAPTQATLPAAATVAEASAPVEVSADRSADAAAVAVTANDGPAASAGDDAPAAPAGRAGAARSAGDGNGGGEDRSRGRGR